MAEAYQHANAELKKKMQMVCMCFIKSVCKTKTPYIFALKKLFTHQILFDIVFHFVEAHGRNIQVLIEIHICELVHSSFCSNSPQMAYIETI